MSDNQEEEIDVSALNEQCVLICGQSAAGKSASLRNMRDQERCMYLNTEVGKRLPFKNKFAAFKVTDPYQVIEGLDVATAKPDEFHTVIIDSLTFLMDQYESQYVLTAANTMAAWSAYQQYFKALMQDKIAKFPGPVAITAHVLSVLNEKTMDWDTSVPIKGALKNNGIEAYFSTVIYAKKVSISELEKYGSDLLTITDEDKELGYKHVFQTRPTKKTIGERIRSPMGMFDIKQTYMDNDTQLLFDHLRSYYA